MVEALVLLPLFTLIFAGLLTMHGLYETKFATMDEAREQVWDFAMNRNCQGAGEFSEETDGPSEILEGAKNDPMNEYGRGPANDSSGAGQGFIDDVSANESSAGKHWGSGIATVTRAHAGVDVFPARQVTSRRNVVCNEATTEETNVVDIVKYAWGLRDKFDFSQSDEVSVREPRK